MGDLISDSAVGLARQGAQHARLALAADVLAALERRGTGLQGAAQRAWARRVQLHREALAQLQDEAVADADTGDRRTHADQPSAIADLLARLAVDDQADHTRLAPAPLKTARLFAPQWAQLRLETRVAAALAEQPADAGPLNSHHLIAQSLRLLQAESPAYLQHFLAWGEGLLRLEQAVEQLDKQLGERGGARRRDSGKRR